MARGNLIDGPERSCEVCGETYVASQPSQRFCKSAKCRNIGAARARANRNRAAAERKCYGCQGVKAAASFRGPSKTYCADCEDAYNADRRRTDPAVRERETAATRKWVAKAVAADPDFYRKLTLAKFGLSIEQFDAILAAQAGKCANPGCRATEPGGRFNTWHVDHDHSCCPRDIKGARKSCGRCIRGLLCQRCNLLLGHARDSVAVLEGAVAYLSRASVWVPQLAT